MQFPPSGMIKLNADAVVSDNCSSLAVVARNDRGELLKAWAKNILPCDPLFAEASAIFWTLQLAISEKFPCILVEGDPKICIDTINKNGEESCWSVFNTICNILEPKKVSLWL